jgi:hypothetical protein
MREIVADGQIGLSAKPLKVNFHLASVRLTVSSPAVLQSDYIIFTIRDDCLRRRRKANWKSEIGSIF